LEGEGQVFGMGVIGGRRVPGGGGQISIHVTEVPAISLCVCER